MELWIRTQNKLKLSKAIEFNVIYREHMWIIEGYDELGRYKTKDRALEVLDEIQEMDFAKNPNVKLTNYGYVYEMPKE